MLLPTATRLKGESSCIWNSLKEFIFCENWQFPIWKEVFPELISSTRKKRNPGKILMYDDACRDFTEDFY